MTTSPAMTLSTTYSTRRTSTQLGRFNLSSKPFYLHLTYQSVHGPFEEPPVWEQIPNGSKWCSHARGSMLNALDRGIDNLTAALKVLLS